MFCSSCGKELVGQTGFCGNCGAAVDLIRYKAAKAPRIGFRNAVKSAFQNAFVFNARSTRAEYCWWVLFQFLWIGLFGAILFALLEELGVALSDNEVLILAFLPLFPSTLSVTVRRLHDANNSGWGFLLNCIPVIGYFIVSFLCLIPGNPEENRWRRLH
jgi:uncharacterized membrane protein YhaH (DUF805 family)